MTSSADRCSLTSLDSEDERTWHSLTAVPISPALLDEFITDDSDYWQLDDTDLYKGHAYLTSLNDVDLDDHAYLLDVLDCDSTSFQLGVDQVYDCYSVNTCSRLPSIQHFLDPMLSTDDTQHTSLDTDVDAFNETTTTRDSASTHCPSLARVTAAVPETVERDVVVGRNKPPRRRKPRLMSQSSSSSSLSSSSSSSSSSSPDERRLHTAPFTRPRRQHKSKTPHLWKFMRALLDDATYNPQYIRWQDKPEGVFRIVPGQSKYVARLWGIKKNNPNMTFDKLSRSLRWCRTNGFLSAVPKNGKYPKKLCFRFGDDALRWTPDRSAMSL